MKHLIMLDYDGTLTPIVKDPRKAILSASRRKLLGQLAHCKDVELAIISGRKLSVVKKLVGVRGIVYVGNHGFEMLIGKKDWIHPAAKKFIPLLKKIKIELAANLHFRGLLLEDKGLTLSVHYRSLEKASIPAFIAAFKRVIKPWQKEIKLMLGKKVFELRPPQKWDKGKAVLRIISKLKLKPQVSVYIGDDTTDEDAFRIINRWRGGYTIWVGKNDRTCAKYRLKDIAAVYRFLGGLPHIREELLRAN